MIDQLKLCMFQVVIRKRLEIFSLKQERSMWFASKVVRRYQTKLLYCSHKCFMKPCLLWIISTVFVRHFWKQKSRSDSNVQKVKLINSCVDILNLRRIINVSRFRILSKVCLKNLIKSLYLIILHLKLRNSLVVNKKCTTFAFDLINTDLWVS